MKDKFNNIMEDIKYLYKFYSSLRFEKSLSEFVRELTDSAMRANANYAGLTVSYQELKRKMEADERLRDNINN